MDVRAVKPAVALTLLSDCLRLGRTAFSSGASLMAGLLLMTLSMMPVIRS